MAISFFCEGIEFKVPTPRKIKSWIRSTIEKHNRLSGNISFIFCNDEYLLGINQSYLNHDTYTDIITFDTSEEKVDTIEGDIYISVDRVRENAKLLGEDFSRELSRVIIHGILHLLGHTDKTAEQKQKMRAAENAALSRLRST